MKGIQIHILDFFYLNFRTTTESLNAVYSTALVSIETTVALIVTLQGLNCPETAKVLKEFNLFCK